MKVKVLEDHDNSYGVQDKEAKYSKKKGDTYQIPDDGEAKVLIAAGLVEEVNGRGHSKSGGSEGA